jgi:hypothetical protein
MRRLGSILLLVAAMHGRFSAGTTGTITGVTDRRAAYLG